jgi:hypothetical protein
VVSVSALNRREAGSTDPSSRYARRRGPHGHAVEERETLSRALVRGNAYKVPRMPSPKSGGSSKTPLPLSPSNNTLLSDDNSSDTPLPIMATKNSNDSLRNEEFGGKQTTLHDEVLVNPELMSDAFMAENREHEMGLWVS